MVRSYELLERAADYLDRYGWTRDGAREEDFVVRRPLCAMNALWWACCDGAHGLMSPFEERTAVRALAAAVPEVVGRWTRTVRPGTPVPCNVRIFDWNDAPERTRDQVTSMLRAVAATLRASAPEVEEYERVRPPRTEEALS